MHCFFRRALPLLLAAALLFSGCARQASPSAPDTPEPAAAQADDAIPETDTEALPFDYTFNPHVISKAYLKAYGPEIEPIFYGFCDAVLSGEDSFPCPSVETYQRLLTIAGVCLPVASHCIDKDRIRVENGTGWIPYTMEHDELMRTVRSFEDRVTAVMTSAVPYREEDFLIAAELLTAVARKDSVDEAALSLDFALSLMPYRAIMENKGICQEIAGEYIYYLLQAGIDATTCSALSRDRESAHMWALVELGGRYYHVDPMFTIEYPDSLAFFGLNDEMRSQYGDFPIENFSYAESDTLRREDYSADSERFKPLWRAESYKIDRGERKLLLSLFDVYAPETGDEFSY